MLIKLDKMKSSVLIDLLSKEHLRIHTSQLGEDVLLWHMCNRKNNGFYIDIGAHHPYRFSNTFLLHKMKNWRGINIDLDKRAIDAFNRERPNDINICAAVSDDRTPVELTIYEDGAVNTIDPLMKERSRKKREPKHKEIIQTETLSDLLDRFLPVDQHIDLLDVDAEGSDVKVLYSNNWEKYRPDIIVVEDHQLRLANPKKSVIYQFLTSQAYVLNSHLRITSIYTDQKQ